MHPTSSWLSCLFRLALQLSVVLSSAASGAQANDVDIGQTIQGVASGRIVLTQSAHESFWRALRTGRPMPDQEIRRMLSGSLEANLDFQQAVWTSAQESRDAGRVVKTPVLQDHEANYLFRAKSLIPLTPGSEEYQRAVHVLEGRFQSMLADADRVLHAAATHGSYELSSGARAEANEATIQIELAGIERTRTRINQLLNPVWKARAQ